MPTAPPAVLALLQDVNAIALAKPKLVRGSGLKRVPRDAEHYTVSGWLVPFCAIALPQNDISGVWDWERYRTFTGILNIAFWEY